MYNYVYMNNTLIVFNDYNTIVLDREIFSVKFKHRSPT